MQRRICHFLVSCSHLHHRNDLRLCIAGNHSHISWPRSFTLVHNSSNCTCTNTNSAMNRSCSLFPCIPLRHSQVQMIISRTPNTCPSADTSIPNANNHNIFSTRSEWLFSRYRIVFRRTVNFFPHAWHFISWIVSRFPCVPYPTSAWVPSSIIP